MSIWSQKLKKIGARLKDIMSMWMTPTLYHKITKNRVFLKGTVLWLSVGQRTAKLQAVKVGLTDHNFAAFWPTETQGTSFERSKPYVRSAYVKCLNLFCHGYICSFRINDKFLFKLIIFYLRIYLFTLKIPSICNVLSNINTSKKNCKV